MNLSRCYILLFYDRIRKLRLQTIWCWDDCFTSGLPDMVSFQTKNPTLGTFWRALDWKMENARFYGHIEYFTDIGECLWPFGTFVLVWYIYSGFGIMYQEKSGNPALHSSIYMHYMWRQDFSSGSSKLSRVVSRITEQKAYKFTAYAEIALYVLHFRGCTLLKCLNYINRNTLHCG
jgi:hypothetical protein